MGDKGWWGELDVDQQWVARPLVTRVTIDPEFANVCYVTLSGYKVDLSGLTSSEPPITDQAGHPSAGIFLMHQSMMVIDPENTNTLYIGTDVGIMYSTDLGGTWNILGTGFPTSVPCHDLTLHEPTRTLVAWTHGRSAFRISLPPTVSVANEGTNPGAIHLSQNYPNPFNPTTIISYQVSAVSRVSLKIYDMLGAEVATLVDETKSPGTHEATWNATGLASGVYLYQLKAGGFSDAKSWFFRSNPS
jgi:hypothetical protein